jgi:hypothetical protein
MEKFFTTLEKMFMLANFPTTTREWLMMEETIKEPTKVITVVLLISCSKKYSIFVHIIYFGTMNYFILIALSLAPHCYSTPPSFLSEESNNRSSPKREVFSCISMKMCNTIIFV